MNYFKPEETRCKCRRKECSADIAPVMLDKLNEIRAEYGKPITILSGARCAPHNKAIGGATKSAHIEGKAADLKRDDDLLTFIMARLDRYNIRLEDPDVTSSWIHIDLRPPFKGKRIFKP